MLFPSENGRCFPLTGITNTHSEFSTLSRSTATSFPIGFNPMNGWGARVLRKAQGSLLPGTRSGRQGQGNRGWDNNEVSQSTAPHVGSLNPHSTLTEEVMVTVMTMRVVTFSK